MKNKNNNNLPVIIKPASKKKIPEVDIPLRRSKCIEKINMSIVVPQVTLTRIIYLYMFLLEIFSQPIKCSRIYDKFTFCENLSSSKQADLENSCNKDILLGKIYSVPGMDWADHQRQNLGILKRLTHKVSGSGHQCSMEKVKLITYTTIFFEKTTTTSTEYVTLNKDECSYMVNIKMCKDALMDCGGLICRHKVKLNESFQWMTKIESIEYNCHVQPRIIDAKNVEDPLFHAVATSCHAQDYFCQQSDSIIIWNKGVIPTCP